MPTLLGAGVLAIGAMLAMRIVRREWKRVNATMQSQRSAKMRDASEAMTSLEQDPQTGAYRPKKD